MDTAEPSLRAQRLIRHAESFLDIPKVKDYFIGCSWFKQTMNEITGSAAMTDEQFVGLLMLFSTSAATFEMIPNFISSLPADRLPQVLSKWKVCLSPYFSSQTTAWVTSNARFLNAQTFEMCNFLAEPNDYKVDDALALSMQRLVTLQTPEDFDDFMICCQYYLD